MKKLFYSFAVSLLLFSCQNSAQDILTLIAYEPEEIVVADTTLLEKYVLNSESTTLTWRAFKPGGEHYGIVSVANGDLWVDDSAILAGNIVVNMATIEVLDLEGDRKGKLQDHLMGSEFFNVNVYPTATFAIAKVIPNVDLQYPFTVRGNLTISGITKSISFKMAYQMVEGNIFAQSEILNLNRTDWGINYMSQSIFNDLKDKFIDDRIELQIKALFVPASKENL